LTIADTATGKATTFENLFSAMIAGIYYLDDKTVAATAFEHVTLIDTESKQTDLLTPFDSQASTYDFNTFAVLRQEKNEAGATEGVVVKYSQENTGEETRLIEVNGESAWINKVTKNYVVLTCKDSRDAYIALVPLN
jgi:hypothetical protein